VADIVDIAAVDPALELTLGDDSLACRGTLSARTRHFVLDAAAVVLARRPVSLTVDISDLHVVDVEGANTFVHLQRLTRDAGVGLEWQGLDSDRLRGILPLGPFRVRRPHHRPVPQRRRVRATPRHPATLPPAS